MCQMNIKLILSSIDTLRNIYTRLHDKVKFCRFFFTKYQTKFNLIASHALHARRVFELIYQFDKKCSISLFFGFRLKYCRLPGIIITLTTVRYSLQQSVHLNNGNRNISHTKQKKRRENRKKR